MSEFEDDIFITANIIFFAARRLPLSHTAFDATPTPVLSVKQMARFYHKAQSGGTLDPRRNSCYNTDIDPWHYIHGVRLVQMWNKNLVITGCPS